jgi:hypothetical protein
MTEQTKDEGSWLEISTDDFLDAIKRLKPGRMLKSYMAKELQIGFLKDEAVFCIEGAQTRRPARGHWNGFVCISYGMMIPYLKVKPETENLRLTFKDGRLSIGFTRFKVQWIEVSPWIGQMVLEAHFLGSSGSSSSKRYCPQCGVREGLNLQALHDKPSLNEGEGALLARLEKTQATHGCISCRHGWRELAGS